MSLPTENFVGALQRTGTIYAPVMRSATGRYWLLYIALPVAHMFCIVRGLFYVWCGVVCLNVVCAFATRLLRITLRILYERVGCLWFEFVLFYKTRAFRRHIVVLLHDNVGGPDLVVSVMIIWG